MDKLINMMTTSYSREYNVRNIRAALPSTKCTKYKGPLFQ